MKRILVYGMTNNRGGIESYLMNYFRNLKRKQIVFDFITEHRNIAYSEEIKQLGSRVYYIPSRRDGLIKHMLAIRKILQSHNEYDTVYFNILSASEVFTVLAAAGVRNVKKIVHSHNNAVKSINRHRILRPLLIGLSDVKLACSEDAALFMFGKKCMRDNKVTIINNAIDLQKYRYRPEVRKKMRDAFHISTNTYVIGHIGRMCYQKNTLFLIEIFNKIHMKDPEALLLLVGEGEDREQVEELIKKYDLKNNVLLLGMRNDVENLLQMMDVFLLPSRFEGLGIVLIEAQAAGLTCVCSDSFGDAANISKTIKYYSLDHLPEEWADVVLRFRNKERENYYDMLVDGGYDVERECNKLALILTEEIHGR